MHLLGLLFFSRFDYWRAAGVCETPEAAKPGHSFRNKIKDKIKQLQNKAAAE